MKEVVPARTQARTHTHVHAHMYARTNWTRIQSISERCRRPSWCTWARVSAHPQLLPKEEMC
jgi:hypothetical protein